MGWDRHKLLWDGTDKYVPWTTLKNSLQFVSLSLSLSMFRMLSVDNLFWNIATLQFFIIFLNLEKDFSPEQLVTIKLRNKASHGWIN